MKQCSDFSVSLFKALVMFFCDLLVTYDNQCVSQARIMFVQINSDGRAISIAANISKAMNPPRLRRRVALFERKSS